MAKSLVRIFNTESYAGGGTFFNDGLYRITEPQFVLYNYNGKAPGKEGNGLVCLHLKLQPVDGSGNDAGDSVVQYWSVGDDFSIENKGKAIASTGQYDTIWNLCDFAVFVDHLGKAGFDRDAMDEENDVTVLDGTVAEFGKVPSPRQKSDKGDEEAGGKKKLPQQIIVVTSIPGVKGAAGTSKPAPKGAVAGKPSAKAPSTVNAEAEAMLTDYLAEKVLTAKNADKGVEKLSARMSLTKYVQGKGGDSDMVKAVSTLFNNDTKLNEILASADWTLEGSLIKPVEAN